MSNEAVLGLRNPGGATQRTPRWGVDSEHGCLRDVLPEPPETRSWMDDGFQYSSVCRASERAPGT